MKKVQYCCRFKRKDGYYSPAWISGKGLSLKEAKAWAERECQRNSDYQEVSDVYEVKE